MSWTEEDQHALDMLNKKRTEHEKEESKAKALKVLEDLVIAIKTGKCHEAYRFEVRDLPHPHGSSSTYGNYLLPIGMVLTIVIPTESAAESFKD